MYTCTRVSTRVCLCVYVCVWVRERVVGTAASKTGRKQCFNISMYCWPTCYYSFLPLLPFSLSSCHTPGPGHYHILLWLLRVSLLAPFPSVSHLGNVPPSDVNTAVDVTLWLQSNTFLIAYRKTYTFLHTPSKALGVPPTFPGVCPLSVTGTWADRNHSRPSDRPVRSLASPSDHWWSLCPFPHIQVIPILQNPAQPPGLSWNILLPLLHGK